MLWLIVVRSVSCSRYYLLKGWGEFPVRVQLLLNDARGRKVDIIHHLKLDRTYTGEQNLGSETHVDVEIDAAPPLDVTVAPDQV